MGNSSARTTVDVGAVIADTYTIEGLLGRGGMGAVFVASHLRLPGKQVAVKVLHPEFVDDEIFARFQREAEIASRLGHPNIVSVLDFNITPEGVPYLVLELLEGRTLGDRIAAGPMTLAEVTPIVRQIGAALAAAHAEGIVHRDLKPANIFLVPTDVGGAVVDHVKVLDFGISKIRGSMTVKTQESSLLGTPQYMAPEQAKGQHGEVDERSDLFALAAIVYEMLSGQPAFRGDSVAEVVFKVVYEPAVPLASLAPEVPPHALAAIERAMQKAPAARFASVAEFVEALTGEPLPTRAKRSSLIPVRAGASGSTRPGVGSAPGRAPAVAAGSGRVVGTEAAQLGVAATIGSAPGRAPTPVPLAIDATAVPAAPSVRSSAPGTGAGTAGPSTGMTASAPAVTIAPVATQPPVAPSAPAPRRWLVPLALALIGGAGVTAYALTRSAPAAPGSPIATGSDDVAAAAPVPDARPVPPPPVDARPVVAAAPPDATPPPSLDARRSRPDARAAAPAVDARGAGSTTAEPAPDDADAKAAPLIQARDWVQLEKLANILINKGVGRGHFLRAFAICGSNDTTASAPPRCCVFASIAATRSSGRCAARPAWTCSARRYASCCAR
jgi:hypothetical protein